MMDDLSARALVVQDGAKTLVSVPQFDHAPHSLTAIMGPMGGGKSTFLRSIAGQPAENWTVRYDTLQIRGQSPDTSPPIAYIPQRIRQEIAPDAHAQIVNQRIAEIDALTPQNTILCIDEPTHSLTASEGRQILTRLKQWCETGSVILVTHHSDLAAEYADQVVLIAAGRQIESTSAQNFFSDAASADAKAFRATGGLSTPLASTPKADLSSEFRQLPPGTDLGDRPDADGINWILPGRLGVLSDTTPKALTGQTLMVEAKTDQIIIRAAKGSTKTLPWKGGTNRPDLDATTVTAVSIVLSKMVAKGMTVLVNTSANPIATAAIIGGTMLKIGASPEDAIQVAKAKFPQLHFGMRFETLIWDLDLIQSD